MPKYSTVYPKQWEAFQRCGAAKLISIEEKFDPEKAEKQFYSHLISRQPIDESLFKSNQSYKSKNNNTVTPYVRDLLEEDNTTTEDKMVQLEQEVEEHNDLVKKIEAKKELIGKLQTDIVQLAIQEAKESKEPNDACTV